MEVQHHQNRHTVSSGLAHMLNCKYTRTTCCIDQHHRHEKQLEISRESGDGMSLQGLGWDGDVYYTPKWGWRWQPSPEYRQRIERRFKRYCSSRVRRNGFDALSKTEILYETMEQAVWTTLVELTSKTLGKYCSFLEGALSAQTAKEASEAAKHCISGCPSCALVYDITNEAWGKLRTSFENKRKKGRPATFLNSYVRDAIHSCNNSRGRRVSRTTQEVPFVEGEDDEGVLINVEAEREDPSHPADEGLQNLFLRDYWKEIQAWRETDSPVGPSPMQRKIFDTWLSLRKQSVSDAQLMIAFSIWLERDSENDNEIAALIEKTVVNVKVQKNGIKRKLIRWMEE